MPWSSASDVPESICRSTLLWPSAAVVKAQDELAALGLDDGPQGQTFQLSGHMDQERQT